MLYGYVVVEICPTAVHDLAERHDTLLSVAGGPPKGVKSDRDWIDQRPLVQLSSTG